MKQSLARGLVIPPSPSWRRCQDGIDLSGWGDPSLLEQPLTAFFASRQCPGVAIRTGMEWALRQARDRNPIIGGFHSPLERSVLELLLEAGSPVVMVLARSVALARINRWWKQAVEQGNLAIVSTAEGLPQLTAQRATTRNDVAARLAATIVIGHASPEGGLGAQIRAWRSDGLRIHELCRRPSP